MVKSALEVQLDLCIMYAIVCVCEVSTSSLPSRHCYVAGVVRRQELSYTLIHPLTACTLYYV